MSRFQFVADHQATFEVKRLCQVTGSHGPRSTSGCPRPRPARHARRPMGPCRADRRCARHRQGVRGAADHRRAQRRRRGGRAGQPQARRPGDARASHRRDPAAPTGADHGARPGRPAGPGPARPGLHGRRTEHEVRRGHHLPALRRRAVPLPGHRDRLLLPPPGRLVDRRPHAHRPGRRRPPGGRPRTRVAGRGDLSQRPRRSYVAKDYTALCERLGATRSMGAVATSADNAMAEPFNASLKRETLAGSHGWPDPATARRAVFAWITRYNTRAGTPPATTSASSPPRPPTTQLSTSPED